MSAHLNCGPSAQLDGGPIVEMKGGKRSHLEEGPTPVVTPTLGHLGPSRWKYPEDLYPLILHLQIQEGELTLYRRAELGLHVEQTPWMSHCLYTLEAGIG